MSVLMVIQVSAVDYLDEFSFDGYNCVYVDEFSYSKWGGENPVKIIGCCNLYQCFYFPINIEQQRLYRKEFAYLLQVESARQNIYKHSLSEDIFRFEGFFDFCEMLNVEPPRDQIIGGIVDVTDKSLPYLINANKAKNIHNTISVLQNLKVISKFNWAAFTLSSTCSFGNNKEDEILRLLSQCHNNFQNIKYGKISSNNLDDFGSCLVSLKSATKRPEGFLENLTEIFYYISSLLTGGNIVDFVRVRMPSFEEYQTALNEDIVKIDLSAEIINNSTELLKIRTNNFENLIKKLKRNIPLWERFLSFFGFKQTNVTQKIIDLQVICGDIKNAQEMWQYKTAHALLDQGFIELNNTYFVQQEANYPIKSNLFCGYSPTYYDILEESVKIESTSYNKTVLVNQDLEEPNVRYHGLDTRRGCTAENCTIKVSFRNDPYGALIDFNATVLIEDELNETNIVYKPLLIENFYVRPNADTTEQTINLDEGYFSVKVINISDYTINVKPNENYFYKELPCPNITLVPINKTKTVFDERIDCTI